MSPSRYEPPRALVETAGGVDAPALSDRPRRPLAVTAFQVLLVLICALSLMKSVRLVAWIATNGDDRYLRDVALQLTWALVCVAATAGAAVAIHRAKRYARYLGWLIFAVLIGLAQIDVSEGAPAQYAATPAIRGGYEAIGALWEILLVIWALRFGPGAKAKRYFGGPNAIAR